MGFGRFRSGGAASGAAQRLWVLSSKQMLACAHVLAALRPRLAKKLQAKKLVIYRHIDILGITLSSL